MWSHSTRSNGSMLLSLASVDPSARPVGSFVRGAIERTGSVANGGAGLVRSAECERTGHRCFQDDTSKMNRSCCVWVVLRYSLSYRDLEGMMAERGLSVDHSTIARWVFAYAPILNERMRRHLRSPNRSWRVDEPYVRVGGMWTYPYRALDSEGNTLAAA